jgi:YD repeat-containing protein
MTENISIVVLGGTGNPDRVTTYSYDLLGRLTQAKDAAKNTWTTTYDLGHRRCRLDPDPGGVVWRGGCQVGG